MPTRLSVLPNKGLERYLSCYNQRRPHSTLDDNTPDAFYFDNLPVLPRAAEARNRKAPLKEWNILSNQTEPPLTPLEDEIRGEGQTLSGVTGTAYNQREGP